MTEPITDNQEAASVASDCSPVDEGWLRNYGFRQNGRTWELKIPCEPCRSTHQFDFVGLIYAPHHDCPWSLHQNFDWVWSVSLPMMKTTDDVRALCSALGLTLGE